MPSTPSVAWRPNIKRHKRLPCDTVFRTWPTPGPARSCEPAIIHFRTTKTSRFSLIWSRFPAFLPPPHRRPFCAPDPGAASAAPRRRSAPFIVAQVFDIANVNGVRPAAVACPGGRAECRVVGAGVAGDTQAIDGRARSPDARAARAGAAGSRRAEQPAADAPVPIFDPFGLIQSARHARYRSADRRGLIFSAMTRRQFSLI